MIFYLGDKHVLFHVTKIFQYVSFWIQGMLMSEQELDNMLAEVGGTCNFENMLKCFEVKLTGEGMANDGDELVLEAMKAYNETSKHMNDY